MIKADADIASDTARKHMDEVEACLQLMKEYNLEGRRDKQRWDAIVRRSEFAARERDRYTAEANAAGAKLVRHQIALVRLFVERMKTLNGLWAPAVNAMRDEIESSSAAELISQEFETNFSELRAAMLKSMDVLELRLSEDAIDEQASRS